MKAEDVAGAIEQGISDRRGQVEQLEREITALEATLGILGGAPAEAPPKTRKKPAVVAPKTSAPRTAPNGVRLCVRGHERTPENVNKQGACKTCNAIYSKAAYERRQAAKKSKTPAADDEAHPAPSGPTLTKLVATRKEPPVRLKDFVPESVRAMPAAAPQTSAAPAVRAFSGGTCKAHCACCGKQCSMLSPHAGFDHNASGHKFRQVLAAGVKPDRDIDAFGGRRDGSSLG